MDPLLPLRLPPNGRISELERHGRRTSDRALLGFDPLDRVDLGPQIPGVQGVPETRGQVPPETLALGRLPASGRTEARRWR